MYRPLLLLFLLSASSCLFSSSSELGENNGASNNGVSNNGASNNGTSNNGTSNNGSNNGTSNNGTSNSTTQEGCGDSKINGTDDCDGQNLGGQTCMDLGDFDGGTLACNDQCTFDTSGCAKCGDGVVGQGEECDGTDFDIQTCSSALGYEAKGSLTCAADCGSFSDENCYPVPVFTQISAAEKYTCGLASNGKIHCWGILEWGNPLTVHSPPVPTGSNFTQVSVGSAHACGLKANGVIKCWGFPAVVAVDAPPPANDPFLEIRAGKFHTCARRGSGKIECWGPINNTITENNNKPKNAGFKKLDVADRYSCAINSNDRIECWGHKLENNDSENNDSINERIFPDFADNLKFKEISLGFSHGCAIDMMDDVHCWGDGTDGNATPPNIQFTSIDASNFHTCGIEKNSQKMNCWGNPNFLNFMPNEQLLQVESGRSHICGLSTTNEVQCSLRFGMYDVTPPDLSMP